MNIKQIFKYTPPKNYNFTLTPYIQTDIKPKDQNKDITNNISLNLKYINLQYNIKINSDIMLREFSLTAKNKNFKAFLLYIDGMVDSDLINRFVLDPLMLRNDSNTFDGNLKQEVISSNPKDNISVKKVKNFNLENYIYSHLMPQNNLKKITQFKDAFSGVNSGNCILFVDTISTAFDIDVKGFKQRSVQSPNNEVIIKGSQEAFVENLRTNTSLLRRIINNENLIIENIDIGKISQTKVAVCYMNNIANPKLVNEVKYRLNNLELDSIFSSGQLEQLIEDTDYSGIPSLISSERPDKCAQFLMQGRVVILLNGTPYSITAPAVLIDFLSSPEDTNLKVSFANFLKLLRCIAYFITLLSPGIFIAITSFHQELLPTELLFSILASRENVPFPIIFELLLMELSFELIRESSLRVPGPVGSTLGIVGALILGDAAVSAHIVSPILIIVVARAGLSSFAIPDFSFAFHLRIYRFLFIILGYIAGFLGIGLGLFVYISMLCSMKSFGVDFTSPFTPYLSLGPNSYFIKPTWKQEQRASYILPKKKEAQPKISKKWKYNN